MKQKLVRGVRNVLPHGAVKHLERVYRGGRTHIMRMRYGNPAAKSRIIAVAGSSGKTTTSQLLMGLLLEAGHSVAVFDPHQHGNTVPALWRGLNAGTRENADFIIIETSKELLQSEALQALVIDTVVIVNPCKEADILLAQPIEYAVIPDTHSFKLLTIAEHQIVSFGKSDTADAKIETVKLYRKGTEVRFLLDHHTPVEIASHLIGRPNVQNIAAAISAAYVLGVPLDTVQEGIARLEAVPGNFESIPTDDPFSLVLDLASSSDSAEQVISSAKELAKRRLIVALAIDKPSDSLLATAQHVADRLVIVGKKGSLPASVEVVQSPAEARAVAERAAKKDDIVLLIGPSFKQN